MSEGAPLVIERGYYFVIVIVVESEVVFVVFHKCSLVELAGGSAEWGLAREQCRGGARQWSWTPPQVSSAAGPAVVGPAVVGPAGCCSWKLAEHAARNATARSPA